MANFSLPHFGEIDTDDLEEYYDAEVEFDGKTIEIDLNFEMETIDVSRLALVKQFMDQIDEWDKKNKKQIEKNYKGDDDDTVRTYVEHHLKDIPRDELAGFVDFDDDSSKPEVQLMKALHLVRIGFYPQESDQFATFDYSLGTELTNYLVVIQITDKGKLDYITMES